MADNTTRTKKLDIHSLAETEKVGLHIGRLLIPGDILLLTGDLGAGKTTLTQSIARGLDVPDEYYITSPSFALMHEYPGRCPLYHFDCYRLSGEDDIEDAGLSEYLETRAGVCVIEWATRLGSLTPDNALRIEIISLADEKRQILFTDYGLHWFHRIDIVEEILNLTHDTLNGVDVL